MTTQLPYTGPAGKRSAGWFERAGVRCEDVYLSAVCRCFQGKARGGNDKVPGRATIGNCCQHLSRELELP